MPTQRRMRFVHWQLAWMGATAVVLATLGSLSYELFFVVSLIGLLIVAKLTAAVFVSHDEQTLAIADRSVRLRDGRVVED